MKRFEPPERWEEIDAVLSAALERPETERIAFVRERTTGDPELGRAVIELLRAGEEATFFLEHPVDLDSRTWREASDEFFSDSRPENDEEDHVGRIIGAWRIERELGRGGMARVFLAERTTGGFEQKAALKLLRSDLDSDIVARFRAERQILSNLSHPNIARLLDGGSTDDARPYLVMEAVDGEPITEWCDRRRLTLRRRLELFRDVLGAVQYAHANLVVHRDLKPSNILVTADGRVKLLDFGIAQIIDPDGLSAGGEASSRLLLTPEYASPEQVTGRPITTASDTYQLGLLLYRLMAGTRPYEVPDGHLGLREAVLHSDPPPPSRAAAEADGIAADARRATPERLARRLRGDLDAIVMKAIRKDPTDRHASVAELDTDLAAHLDSRPVAAVGGGPWYRMRKYFGRNAWALPALTAGLITLAAYVGVQRAYEQQLETERNVARAEASRAEAVKAFMVDLFRSADPWSSPDPQRGRDITVRAALTAGADRARTELTDQPDIQVELLAAIAGVYDNLGLAEDAIGLLHEALETASATDPDDRVTRSALLLQLGRALHGYDRHDTAEVVLASALDVAGTLDPPHDTARATALSALGANLFELGRYERAESLLLRADSLLAAQPGATLRQRARVQTGLSNTYSALNRLDEARAAARRRVELVTEASGDDSPSTAAALVRLADVLDLSGSDRASIGVYRQAVATLERALGEEHEATLSTLNNLAITLRQVGEEEEAEALLRRVLDIRTRGTGVWDRDVANTMQNLATVLRARGELDEAMELLTRAHRVYTTVLPEGHHVAAYPLLTRSAIELERGAHAAAEATTREALSTLTAALPAHHPAPAMARCRLGRALLGQGKYSEAEPALREGTDVVAEATQLSADYRAECLGALADVLEATGREAEARPYRTATTELTSTPAR